MEEYVALVIRNTALVFRIKKLTFLDTKLFCLLMVVRLERRIRLLVMMICLKLTVGMLLQLLRLPLLQLLPSCL